MFVQPLVSNIVLSPSASGSHPSMGSPGHSSPGQSYGPMLSISSSTGSSPMVVEVMVWAAVVGGAVV